MCPGDVCPGDVTRAVVASRAMLAAMRPTSKLGALKEELETTLAAGKLGRAVEIARELRRLEPEESRWAQKAGDILRRQHKPIEAAAELEVAARMWAKQGFMARAIAMAKTVISLDPTRQVLLSELDPAVAREEHRKARPAATNPGLLRPRLHSTLPTAAPGAAAPERVLTLAEAAPELAPAPDADEDEIRFVTEPSAVLDLSEIVLLDEDLLSLDVTERDAPRAIDKLASLPGFPLFAELSQEILAKLAEGSELLEAEAGEVVFRRGDHADALYAIVEGAVRVEVPSRPVLREGELFGEACLSGSARRSADVTVEQRLVALRFPRTLLDRIKPAAPALERVLVEALGRRVLATAIASSRLFAPLSSAERRELGLLFDLRRAVPRLPLLSRGKTSDSLYVVLSDELDVELEDGTRRVLGSGSLVGERAVWRPGPSNVTALAPRGAVVLQLTAAKLAAMAAARPVLARHLASLEGLSNVADAARSVVS